MPSPYSIPASGLDAAVRASDQAGHQHHAGHHDRQDDQEPAAGTLPEQRPGGERDEQHLQVTERPWRCRPRPRRSRGSTAPGRRPGTARPRRPGRAAARPRPAPALLQHGQRRQHRQREQAPVERRGGRARVGQLDQHRRGGDARRAQAGQQHGRRAAGLAPAGPARPALPVRTVLAYGADMISHPTRAPDRSQKGFGADLIEALAARAELINTGRSGGRRRACATCADVPRSAPVRLPREPRPGRGTCRGCARTGPGWTPIAVRCEAGDDDGRDRRC